MNLQLETGSLEALITKVVEESFQRLEEIHATLPDKLAYSEEEAARLIGLEPHQLRDERLRGRVAASQIVGRRIRYLRDDLVAYLLSRRFAAKAEKGVAP